MVQVIVVIYGGYRASLCMIGITSLYKIMVYMGPVYSATTIILLWPLVHSADDHEDDAPVSLSVRALSYHQHGRLLCSLIG